MIALGTPALASFAITILAILALRPVALAIDFVDRPGGRKTHHGDVPIVGGLAIFLGVVLGLGLVSGETQVIPEFLTACTLLVTIGLVDDRFTLSPWTRLPVQIAAAILMVFGTGALVRTLGQFPHDLGAELHGLAAYVFTVLITIGAINAFNMLDGMDGLAGATAVISLVSLAYFAWSKGLWSTAAISLVIAGAVSAFLLFNVPIRFNRAARCFMGDGGSTLLGFAVAWLSICVSQSSVRAASPVTVLWIVALPLYELVWTTIRRIIRGVSPFRPDRDHFHHLLLRAGLGVRGAFLVYIGIALALAAVGILMHQQEVKDWESLTLLLVAGIVVVRFMYRADVLWRVLPVSLQRLPASEIIELPRAHS